MKRITDKWGFWASLLVAGLVVVTFGTCRQGANDARRDAEIAALTADRDSLVAMSERAVAAASAIADRLEAKDTAHREQMAVIRDSLRTAHMASREYLARAQDAERLHEQVVGRAHRLGEADIAAVESAMATAAQNDSAQQAMEAEKELLAEANSELVAHVAFLRDTTIVEMEESFDSLVVVNAGLDTTAIKALSVARDLDRALGRERTIRKWSTVAYGVALVGGVAYGVLRECECPLPPGQSCGRGNDGVGIAAAAVGGVTLAFNIGRLFR